MNGTNTTNALGRLHSALTLPLLRRCHEVAAILQDTNLKEIYNVLPALIESIFGFNNQQGWGVATCKIQFQDFRDLRQLLAPNGPLLAVIYKMCNDPYMKYDFPVACIPAVTQRQFEAGNVGHFFANKIQVTHTGRPHNMMRLNPFDLYFFHFTYYLIGLVSTQKISWMNPAEALYPVLLEDYMNYFLPLDEKCGPPPAPPTASPGIKSPLVQYNSPLARHRQSPASQSPLSQRSSPFSGLLKLQSPRTPGQHGSHSTGGAGSSLLGESTEEQTWRSQTFLQILIEQWMTCSSYDVDRLSFNTSNLNWPNRSYSHESQEPYYRSPSMNDRFGTSRSPYNRTFDWTRNNPGNSDLCNASRGAWGYQQCGQSFDSYADPLSGRSNYTARDALHYFQDPYYQFVLESHLPSMEQIRLVRMLIKHLHFFSNSAAAPPMTSMHYTPSAASPWQEFKRSVLQMQVQKRCYKFLKHNFERWPLDASFRMMLECWLSYIQPWRYTDPSHARARELETAETKVDEKWRHFINENLLFYTVLFESFVQRALRLDLCTPKSANLVFRVAKIFNLPNLRELIEDAEQYLFSPGLSRGLHSSLHDSLGAHASRHQPSIAPSTLTLRFTELEGPMFEYQPMFCEATGIMVWQLILQMNSAKITSKDIGPKPTHNNSSFFSFLGSASSADLNTTTFSGCDYDEFGGGAFDSKKMVSHLDLAINNLCKIFDFVPPDSTPDDKLTWGDAARPVPTTTDTLTPDVQLTEDGPQLSPLGRYQLLSGRRRFDVAYEGDPDTQPIRSYESAVLVRATHEISTLINQRYGDVIRQYYYRDDLLARIVQQFISLPYKETSSEVTATHLSPVTKQRRQHFNQPRISLRWLASYHTVGYFLAFYVFMYMWFGLGLVGSTFLLGLLVFVFTLLLATIRPPRGEKKVKKQ